MPEATLSVDRQAVIPSPLAECRSSTRWGQTATEVAAEMIQETCPGFLTDLDSDPDRAFAAFYEFTWRLLQSNPPSAMRALSQLDREDVITNVIYHCWRDDQRKLRSYRDQGKPFAKWLTVVAWHEAIDFLRARNPREVPFTDSTDDRPGTPQDDYPAGNAPPDGPAIVAETLAILAKALKKLSVECQLLIELRAQGYKPREMIVLLGWPADKSNKDISDQARHCVKRLKEILREAGHDWRELIQAVAELPTNWVME